MPSFSGKLSFLTTAVETVSRRGKWELILHYPVMRSPVFSNLGLVEFVLEKSGEIRTNFGVVDEN